MIAFPYNDMFSTEIQDLKFKKYYVVKLNNDRIEFSHFPYWKKDLLEQAPLKYANYLNNNSQNDVTVFLKSKIHDSSLLFFLEKRMTAYHINSSDWLRWYADYSGNPLNKRDSISLIEYHISFEKDFPTLTDSFIICKTIIK